MARKNYTDEFRQRAVDLFASTPGATLKGIAADLGISRGALREWVEKHGSDHDHRHSVDARAGAGGVTGGEGPPAGGREREAGSGEAEASDGAGHPSSGGEVSGFAKDPEVGAALEHMRADLRQRGFLLSPLRALALRLQWVLPLALTALGIVRCVAGSQNHKPIANLTFLTVVSAIGTLVSIFMARTRGHLPRATSRALHDLRKASRGLLPRSTSGSPGNAKAQARAPMCVALFGTAALIHAAPDLSECLGIPTLTFATLPAAGGGGGTDTSSSTWSCSSGSSCGSSSSCGG